MEKAVRRRNLRQWLVITLIAIAAIIVNVFPDAGANVGIAIITTVILAGSATLMGLQR